jgi:hypothetical protein
MHQSQTDSRIIQLIIQQNCHVTETSHNNIEEFLALVLAGIFPLLSGLALIEIPDSQNAHDKPNPRNSNLCFSISKSPMKSHTQSQSWPAQSLSRKTLMPTPHDLTVMILPAFQTGCREEEKAFYVPPTSNKGEEERVTSYESSWSDNWRKKNTTFEELLLSDSDLWSLLGRMFYVWDGNHRLQAWYPYIERVHPNDEDWHV